MSEKKRIIYGLSLAGIFFIGASFLISVLDKPQQNLLSPQAKLISLGKGVKVIRKSLSSTLKLKPGTDQLYLMDTVETDADSAADLEFPDGHRFQIGELSRITLDRRQDTLILDVQSGSLVVEQVGSDQVLVFENGSSLSSSEYQKKFSYKEDHPHSPVTQHHQKIGVHPEGETKQETPPREYVENTIKQHKKHFYKCYSQLLEKKPGLTGQASLRFTIERNGKVRSPEISFCSIKDNHFRKCLVEALRRIEFHAYRGESINTFFPLKFE